ncbi:ABC transporter permease [Streptomyces phaeochromogenes]|uniref:ABC transporter permease n=1 Tax=Streptomyces phaeochromogenes TaxID=1923 RepID=UPI002DDB2AF1|nr:ABC transporter permease [Streptomyces phaeochromogenes]WRZ34577.1 ABC transporter permease [Streptomyces phaeochromogenes]
MLHVVSRRLLSAVPLLLVVSVLSFVLGSFAPGNVAESMLGEGATPQAVAKLNHQLGLDQPLLQRYWDWLSAAFHGDLGSSTFSGQPVTSLIADRLPVTLSLTILALVISIVIGVAAGAIGAIFGGVVARMMDSVSVLMLSIPNFWLGTVMIAVFAVQFRLFPASGYVPFGNSPSAWLSSLVMPVFCIAVVAIATIALNTRGAMLAALRSDFVRSLRANGIPARSVLFKHVLRNAGGLVLTIVSMLFVGLLGGTVLMEQVFGMAGLGSLATSATNQHDLPVVQGLVVLYTLIVIVVFALNDVALAYLNPKVVMS